MTEDSDNQVNQSKVEINIYWQREAWENVCERVMIGFGLWITKWSEIFKPIA